MIMMDSWRFHIISPSSSVHCVASFTSEAGDEVEVHVSARDLLGNLHVRKSGILHLVHANIPILVDEDNFIVSLDGVANTEDDLGIWLANPAQFGEVLLERIEEVDDVERVDGVDGRILQEAQVLGVVVVDGEQSRVDVGLELVTEQVTEPLGDLNTVDGLAFLAGNELGHGKAVAGSQFDDRKGRIAVAERVELKPIDDLNGGDGVELDHQILCKPSNQSTLRCSHVRCEPRLKHRVVYGRGLVESSFFFERACGCASATCLNCVSTATCSRPCTRRVPRKQPSSSSRRCSCS
mmetsp:Transcript_12621/g.34776  ORF Transcript_12621/g.34776 Transcript_12621/m.34776 type:complete len:294 (-) Transcript_12621:165-1046(-)